MFSYTNGNAKISIFDNGTRHIESDDDVLKLEYPLNIDIRVSTKCSFGLNEKTGKAKCSFCHESALVNGKVCDYQALLSVLEGLPQGIELAIGANFIDSEFIQFLTDCKSKGWICNVTVNQGHLKSLNFRTNLEWCVKNEVVKGLGISYRPDYKDVIPNITISPNAVFHVIAGIDKVNEILRLSSKGVKKILVLGEKDFGFNIGKVDLTTNIHKEWYHRLPEILSAFEVVSFDNLGIQQLNVKRFIKPSKWAQAYQGEHSMYINAVDQVYSPSSRSNVKVGWNDISLKDFFVNLEKDGNHE
jgi:hypothetical protein